MAEHPTRSGIQPDRFVSVRNGFDLSCLLAEGAATITTMKRFFFTLVCLIIGTLLEAQDNPVSEFEKKVEQQIEKRIVKEAKVKAEAAPLPTGLIIICEFIEVEAMEFSDWLLENPITTDATLLRMQAQEWVKSGSGKIAETMVVHARSGQRAKTEAIHEWLYATEYDPPEISAQGGDAPNGENVTPANPTAFETRNVGYTLEVDPVLNADGTLVDLNLAPEVVIAGENSKHGAKLGDLESSFEMPRFMTTKMTTQVQVRVGDYSFLGTSRLGKTKMPEAEDPIVLAFVRVDVSGE